MIGEKMMDQKAFIESIDSTIDRLKKEIRFYNRVIGIGNIIKIVLSASIPILIDQASEHRSLLIDCFNCFSNNYNYTKWDVCI